MLAVSVLAHNMLTGTVCKHEVAPPSPPGIRFSTSALRREQRTFVSSLMV